jgi:DNA-directed RNA polymerase specialized sigma24 family protein
MDPIPSELLAQSQTIIDKLVAQRAAASKFGYFTTEDIAQEIRIMCLQALRSYQPERGTLEHFLRSHVANRLRNLQRDRYFRPSEDGSVTPTIWCRINLMNPLALGMISKVPASQINGNPFIDELRVEEIDQTDYIHVLMSRLPSGMAVVAQAYLEGLPVDTFHFVQLVSASKDVMGEPK